jgi:Cof subfamily protein (haloacid dehalogenase superfamily)
MFPYKLAVFDMDDTLLGPDRALSAENAAALRRLRAAGVEVVIASGRHSSNIVEFEHEIGFSGWVISSGGAAVTHSETGEILCEMTVPQPLGLELFQRAREQKISVIAYHRTGIFCDAPSEWIDLYTRRTHQVAIADIPALIDTGMQKLIWSTHRDLITQLLPELQQQYHEQLYVVRTEHEMIDFLHPRANKALATQALAAKLGVSQKDILAFGDGNNDVPLLEWAGMSVAMAHGRDSARKAAKKISPPGPPETAVARSVEALFDEQLGNR